MQWRWEEAGQMGAISSVSSTAFFIALVQPWQEFHQWLAEIARCDDNLDVGVRERNKNSDLSY